MNPSTLFAVIAAAMTILGVLSPAHPADLLVSSSNNNRVLRYNGTTGALPPCLRRGGEQRAHQPRPAWPSVPTNSFTWPRAPPTPCCGTTDDRRLHRHVRDLGVYSPAGMIFGRDGHLYVASRGDHRVVRYDGTTGAFLGDFVTAPGAAGSPSRRAWPSGPTATCTWRASHRPRAAVRRRHRRLHRHLRPADLDGPEGLAFGADGHLYVASFANNRVLRYNGTSAPSSNAFVATGSGRLDGPVGLAFGLDGHLYVASFNNDDPPLQQGQRGLHRHLRRGGQRRARRPDVSPWNPVKVVDAAGRQR